jgi:hypothetical protein
MRRADHLHPLLVISFTLTFVINSIAIGSASPPPNLTSSDAALSVGHGPFRSSTKIIAGNSFPSAFPLWTTSQLSQGRALLLGVSLSVQQLVLFAGGWNLQSQATYSNVDIYDAPMSKWSTAQMSTPRVKFGATSLPVEGLALFAGGFNGPPNQPTTMFLSSVDIFNANTRTWSTALLSVARGGLTASSLPGLSLAFFAGGSDAKQGTPNSSARVCIFVPTAFVLTLILLPKSTQRLISSMPDLWLGHNYI